MKTCTNCRVNLNDQHTVCWNCGTPVLQEPKKMTRIDFLNFLYARFSKGELENITYDLMSYGVRWDDIPGETQKAKAQGLMTYFERHDKLAVLWNHCANLRPGVFPLYDSTTIPEVAIVQEVAVQKPVDTADDLLNRATTLLVEAMALIQQAKSAKK